MGFGNLPCIKCGEETTIRLDLDDCDRMTCGECSAEFTLAEVQDVIGRWQPVLQWLGTAPQSE